MPVIVVAQLTFVDRVAYDRYQARFMDVFEQFSGRILASDENPKLIEGSFCPDKVVVMAFPGEDEFPEWAGSAEYQEILRDRKAGASKTVLLIRSFAS